MLSVIGMRRGRSQARLQFGDSAAQLEICSVPKGQHDTWNRRADWSKLPALYLAVQALVLGILRVDTFGVQAATSLAHGSHAIALLEG